MHAISRYRMLDDTCICYAVHDQAPRGSQIAIKFVGDFGVYCQGGICNHWVEIRYRRMSRPGPRFCCRSTPNQIIRTQWEKAHIVFKAKLDVKNVHQRRGFQIHFAIGMLFSSFLLYINNFYLGHSSKTTAHNIPMCWRH